uniref:Uncharacterized protein n=1 Tax=Arundo donax TaxID=35708 RepID=A0A0A9FFE9_ARUDO
MVEHCYLAYGRALIDASCHYRLKVPTTKHLTALV